MLSILLCSGFSPLFPHFQNPQPEAFKAATGRRKRLPKTQKGAAKLQRMSGLKTALSPSYMKWSAVADFLLQASFEMAVLCSPGCWHPRHCPAAGSGGVLLSSCCDLPGLSQKSLDAQEREQPFSQPCTAALHTCTPAPSFLSHLPAFQ